MLNLYIEIRNFFKKGTRKIVCLFSQAVILITDVYHKTQADPLTVDRSDDIRNVTDHSTSLDLVKLWPINSVGGLAVRDQLVVYRVWQNNRD